MPLSELKLALHEQEPFYRGDPTLVGLEVADKTLHIVSSISKGGKTRTIGRLVERFPDTAAAITLTDRNRKEGDPLPYKTREDGITFDYLLRLKMNGELVNYAISPSTGTIYATTVESYPKKHNYLPTLTSNIAQFENSDFAAKTKTYIVLAGNALRGRIEGADFKGERRPRMEEGIVSVTYALEHMNDFEFIKSHQGENHLDETVNELMEVTLGGLPGRDKNDAEIDLKEMLAVAKSFAVQSE